MPKSMPMPSTIGMTAMERMLKWPDGDEREAERPEHAHDQDEEGQQRAHRNVR